jgi:hypothetical protein
MFGSGVTAAASISIPTLPQWRQDSASFSRVPAHSERRLQRGLEVGKDSFSDSAGRGTSTSSSSVLQH